MNFFESDQDANDYAMTYYYSVAAIAYSYPDAKSQKSIFAKGEILNHSLTFLSSEVASQVKADFESNLNIGFSAGENMSEFCLNFVHEYTISLDSKYCVDIYNEVENFANTPLGTDFSGEIPSEVKATLQKLKGFLLN